MEHSCLPPGRFLARDQGRTLGGLQVRRAIVLSLAADEGLVILSTTRPQIELYVPAMEERRRGCHPIDRQLSTVCGFYRFAHIDGRIASNRPSTSAGPRFIPTTPAECTGPSWGRSCSAPNGVEQAHAALAVLLGLYGPRVTEARSADIENLGFERRHRTLRIVGKGN
jgi:site-specific recombinase XerD